MFIKEVKKRNPGYEKVYVTHRLMESYRIAKGPRQKTILNLGRLEIPREKWKLLADMIEAKVKGYRKLFVQDEEIERLAVQYANLIIRKGLIRGEVLVEEEEPEYETIDIKSVTDETARTIGGEYVGVEALKELKLDWLFKVMGFREEEIKLAELSIVGRLVYPASEHATREWARYMSGIDELLGTDFSTISNNALYRISDKLLEHKGEIERYLCERERELFSLKESVILYDLTNTYFEGDGKKNRKAKRGHSKEKRYDRPLVTLGLVMDEEGFPRASKIFKGNVSEAATLEEMIEALEGGGIKINRSRKKDITVVIDAGIASEENIEYLKAKGYDYICVARNKPVELWSLRNDSLLTIREDNKNKVEVKLIRQDGESVLYCRSFLKEKKEQAMKTLFQERFEEGLKSIEESLRKKGGTKKYEKVIERIGRLKGKYPAIAHFYDIRVEKKGRNASGINWKLDNPEKVENRFSGSYFLRTSRTDLREEQIWSLYVMLTNVEEAFRCLKSDLKLRPVEHQKEERVDAHAFIVLLAYHLLISIQKKLRAQGIHMRWPHIRNLLSTHVRITNGMTNKEGERIYIRKTSIAEPFHKKIYDALGLSHCPLKAKRFKV